MVVVDHCRHLPTQPQVQRQVWTEAPVVLSVQAKNSLAQSLRSYGACIFPCEFARVIGEKTRQRAEGEDSAGIGVGETVELLSLHPASEFQGVGSVGPKGVVISLERIPGIDKIGIPVHTAIEKLKNRWHSHMGGELIGYGKQSGVLSQGVDGCHALIVQLPFTAKSKASGIHQCGAKGVGLFQGSDLPIGLRADQHRIEAIGRAPWGEVAQVGTRKAVLVRNLVITPDCEEVLIDDLLSGESGNYSVADLGQAGIR